MVKQHRTVKEFKQQVEKYEINIWPLDNCTKCGHPNYFIFRADNVVKFGSGCYCLGRHEPVLKSWDDVAEFYNSQKEPAIINKFKTFWRFEDDEVHAYIAEDLVRFVNKTLTSSEYQDFVEAIWDRGNDTDAKNHYSYKQLKDLFIMGMGFYGEAGEVSELLKKDVRDGVIDLEELKKELGDRFYYLTRLCSFYNITLQDIIQTNVDKLLKLRGDVNE